MGTPTAPPIHGSHGPAGDPSGGSALAPVGDSSGDSAGYPRSDPASSGLPALRSLPPSLVVLLAVACGMSVANVYYAHPLLDAIAESFGISRGAMGIVVTVTQVGYGLGLFLLVPLGDILHRRRLIVTQMMLAVGVLVVVGTASSRLVLLPAMAVMGLLAVVVQVLVAYAAALAPEHQRGQVVGTVTSGVVVGILLSRTLAGAIAEVGSWRAVYLTSAALTSILVVVLARALPRQDHHEAPLPYGRLLRSTVELFVTEPLLRARAILALCSFAAFSVLWSSLVLPLSAPPLSLSHGVIGLFGLVGAAGALSAVRAGRLADRGLGQATTGVALTLLVVSWLPIGFARHSLLSLVVGLLLLDLAVQAVHVTSQSLIYRIDPAARSRLAGGYMVFYSVGSAAGSIASTAIYARAGWTGVCLLGAAISAAGLAFWAATLAPRTRRERSPSPTGTRSAPRGRLVHPPLAATRPPGQVGEAAEPDEPPRSQPLSSPV